jgi:signal transduction histidine kinase
VTPRSRGWLSALSRLHRPRRTLRMRLALLYGALFLVSAAALIAFTDSFLVVGSTRVTARVPTGGAVSKGVALARHQHGTNLHQLLLISIVALGVIALLSVPFGWLVAGRVLRPFRTIMTTARDISANNLHQRLDLDGPYDEFVELGETLDDLFERLEASFDSQRHFVANASHELRTPLTAERALLQVALADPGATVETLRSTCEELLTLGGQQERLIEALLTLASGERGVEQWEPFDLADVAQKIVLVRRHEAERREIHLVTTLTAAPAAGDPSLVESLVANLVDNALRHNVAGGQVEISTTTKAGRAAVSVSNTGTMVPPEDVGRLFQPFQRLGRARIRHADGHGLGLAIVGAIASAHDATVTAAARAGGGLDIEVSFSASGAPPS